MEKIIYSTHANSGFLDGTLEIYSDKLVLIGKKKTIEYKFIDMTNASHSMGSLYVALKNGKTDVFNISDKKLRLEIIDYINNQLTNMKANNKVDTNNIKVKETKIEKADNQGKNTKENADVLNNQNDNNTSNNNSKIIIGVVIFIVGILIFYYYWNGVVHGNITNMKGCYIVDDVLESDVSLCFDGSKVDYSYHGSSTTLNVKRLENSVYITNEYDDYMFTCEISTNDDNKMKCKSYNKALGSGSFYFVKE